MHGERGAGMTQHMRGTQTTLQTRRGLSAGAPTQGNDSVLRHLLSPAHPQLRPPTALSPTAAQGPKTQPERPQGGL